MEVSLYDSHLLFSLEQTSTRVETETETEGNRLETSVTQVSRKDHDKLISYSKITTLHLPSLTIFYLITAFIYNYITKIKDMHHVCIYIS